MESLNPESDLATEAVPHSASVARCVACLQDLSTAPYLLPDYVPMQRFGRLQSAEAVTIGINPAPNRGGRRAIPLVSGFGRASRPELQDDDLISIAELQTAYFDKGNAHAFFDGSFYFVLHTIDKSWTYQSGKIAHIDVVLCVTDPLWSKLGRSDAGAQATIRRNCRSRFFGTLEMIAPRAWLFWGGQETVKALSELNPIVHATGVTKEKQVAWHMGEIQIKGSPHPFVAWDKVGPGMSNSDRCEIGEAVKARILDLASGN